MYTVTFIPGKVLEIGGGEIPIRDTNGNRMTFNMDVRSGKNIDVTHDLEAFPWPFEDESFENIFAKYVLEHVSWRNINKVIGEIHRILKKDGKLIAVVPNTLAQCEMIVKEGITEKTIESLFGSQEFTPSHLGAHKTGFSPRYSRELFKNAGFSRIDIFEHPEASTDMIIEAYKMERKTEDEKEEFERAYFEDGITGYTEYRDFATHYTTSRIILNSIPPLESFIDIGGARGYLARIIENHGIKSAVMDISKHCRDTRVIENYILHDARNIPWPIKDKEYDFLMTMNFLEHLDINELDGVLHEIDRISKRSMHGIHMTDMPIPERDKDKDTSHKIHEPKNWWEDRFRQVIPGHKTVIEHPRFLEYDKPHDQPPISYAPNVPDNLKKVNLGSYKDMFYYDWENCDIIDLSQFAKEQSYVFRPCDVTKGLPYKDGEVDIVFSSHLMEHLTREEGMKLLKECHRVMKPGGIIRLSIPDTRQITQKYLDGKISDYRYVNTGVENCMDDADAYYNLLLANHKTLYDKDSLTKALEKAGFIKIEQESPFKSRSQVIQTQTTNCHQNLSIILEAEKPNGNAPRMNEGLLEVIST